LRDRDRTLKDFHYGGRGGWVERRRGEEFLLQGESEVVVD